MNAHLRTCICSTMLAAAGALGQTWDPTADFSLEHGNPNGVWTYGWMPVGFGELHLLSNHGLVNGNPVWGGWSGDHTPAVWQNWRGPMEGVETGQIALHPGPGTEPCVLRWTSPVEGWVRVAGAFLPGNSGTMLVAVRVNELATWNATDQGAFDLDADVSIGGTIDFAVYGGYVSGATPLVATIEAISAPCAADYNQDGGIDGADVEAFFVDWESGLPTADVNADGGVDGADVGTFFQVWEAGGCE